MIRLFQQFIPRRKLLLIASECFLLVLAIFIGTSVKGLATRSLSDATTQEVLKGILSAFTVAVLCQVSLSYNDLYDWRVSQNRADLPTRLLHASGFSFIALAIIVFFVPWLFQFPGIPELAGQTWKLVLILGLSFIILYYWRIGFHWFFYKWSFAERILILGSGTRAQQLNLEIAKHPETGFEVIGYMAATENSDGINATFLGPTEKLPEVARREKVSRVIVALEDRRGALPVAELLSCRLAGVRVEEGESLYEKIHGRMQLETIRPSYLIFSDGFRKSRVELATKRIMDILLSFVGLVLTALLWPIIALAIKLESAGPILFKQARVGLDGQEFMRLKFRSMQVNAEAETGPVWAGNSAHRITKVGRILRKSRLDELPQMFNILIGKMSFVGPRPERPFFVDQLSAEVNYYAERLTVRPGLTGWAQINHPYGASVEDAKQKLMYDLYYVKNMSPLFDISILLQTVKVILFGKGAR